MLNTNNIILQIKEIENELIDLKNELHKIPEIGGKEFKTSALVQKFIKSLGLEIFMLNETTFYTLLDTKIPGKTLFMRADMDGLSMEESDLNTAGIKKDEISHIPEMCHCCGHDAHTAVLMKAIETLVKNKNILKGKIYFIFEGGEENGAASKVIFDFITKFKPDGMFGFHFSSNHPYKTISVDPGVRTAGNGFFKFKVVGKGGHSSRPDQSINPIIAASNAILALQSLIPLNIDSNQSATLAVTSIHAGNVYNIIPDFVEIKGSYRFLDIHSGNIIKEKLPEVIENAVKTFGCTFDYTKIDKGSIPIINDEKISKIAKIALNKVHPEMDISSSPLMASETMGKYFTEVPGCFAWIGIASKELGTDAPHHNKHFDIPKDMLLPALNLSVQFAIEFLTQKNSFD